jgi:hypothetical protein
MARATAWLIVPSPPAGMACSLTLIVSARRSSASLASAAMASTLTSLSGPLQHWQQVLDALLVAEFADAADHGRQGFHFAAQHFDEAGQGFGAADFRQRIDGALAHPPVGILGGLDQLSDGTLVLGLVENFNGRSADVLVLVLDQRENGVDDARSADLAERIGRPGAHPPIAVGNHLQQVLDRLGGCRPRSRPRPRRGGRTRSRP